LFGSNFRAEEVKFLSVKHSSTDNTDVVKYLLLGFEYEISQLCEIVEGIKPHGGSSDMETPPPL
jgi:hypothetical protein